MLNLALSGTDPVVFLESQLLYDMGEQFEKDGVPEGYYETPEGTSVVTASGHRPDDRHVRGHALPCTPGR